MVNVKKRVLQTLALLLKLSHQIGDVTLHLLYIECSTLKGDQVWGRFLGQWFIYH